MKLSIAGIVFLFLSSFLNGQTLFPTKEDIQQFKASKTCIVLEEDQFSGYNTLIKEAVKKYWKITPYEFIEVNEFNIRRLNPAYSFIVLTQTNFGRDKSNALYNFVNLIQGKNVNKIGEMPEICAIPLSFAGEDEIEYSYKLGAILSFIQKHAMMISEDPSVTGRRYLIYYNKFNSEIPAKRILVKSEDLTPDLSTIEKIKAIYPYKIEIVDEDVIVKAIENKEPNTLILHKVGPGPEKKSGYCFKMLIGTDDSNMYYYNHHLIDKANPDGLLPADLKRIIK